MRKSALLLLYVDSPSTRRAGPFLGRDVMEYDVFLTVIAEPQVKPVHADSMR
jgi:hypothetical protein